MKNFNLKNKISASVSKMAAYTPGEQPQGGGWIKLNTNESPYPPSPKVKEAILKKLGDGSCLRLYPDPESKLLRQTVAKRYGVKPENAFAGNGSDDVLNLFVRAFSDKKLKIAALHPSYSLYPVLAKIQNADYIDIDFNPNTKDLPVEKIVKSGANLFFLTNPNAPTSHQFPFKQVEALAKKFRGILLIDEAYEPFSKYESAKLVKKYKNTAICCTASKCWALAGMRVGWAVASREIITELDKVRDSYNLDALAQVAAIAALNDKAYYKNLVAKIKATRKSFSAFLKKLGWELFDSNTNFVFVAPKNAKGKSSPKVAKELLDFLKANKILVRYFASDKAINRFLRISIGTDSDMQAVQNTILKWLKK